MYELSPELREKISKYIDWNRISEQQKTFIYYILEKHYSRDAFAKLWEAQYHESICKDSMTTCVGVIYMQYNG